MEAFIIQLIDLLKDEDKDANFCNELQENVIQRLMKIGPQHPTAFKVLSILKVQLEMLFQSNQNVPR